MYVYYIPLSILFLFVQALPLMNWVLEIHLMGVKVVNPLDLALAVAQVPTEAAKAVNKAATTWVISPETAVGTPYLQALSVQAS